jgi:hypothetical protein
MPITDIADASATALENAVSLRCIVILLCLTPCAGDGLD